MRQRIDFVALSQGELVHLLAPMLSLRERSPPVRLMALLELHVRLSLASCEGGIDQVRLGLGVRCRALEYFRSVGFEAEIQWP